MRRSPRPRRQAGRQLDDDRSLGRSQGGERAGGVAVSAAALGKLLDLIADDTISAAPPRTCSTRCRDRTDPAAIVEPGPEADQRHRPHRSRDRRRHRRQSRQAPNTGPATPRSRAGSWAGLKATGGKANPQIVNQILAKKRGDDLVHDLKLLVRSSILRPSPSDPGIRQ